MCRHDIWQHFTSCNWTTHNTSPSIIALRAERRGSSVQLGCSLLGVQPLRNSKSSNCTAHRIPHHIPHRCVSVYVRLYARACVRVHECACLFASTHSYDMCARLLGVHTVAHSCGKPTQAVVCMRVAVTMAMCNIHGKTQKSKSLVVPVCTEPRIFIPHIHCTYHPTHTTTQAHTAPHSAPHRIAHTALHAAPHAAPHRIAHRMPHHTA